MRCTVMIKMHLFDRLYFFSPKDNFDFKLLHFLGPKWSAIMGSVWVFVGPVMYTISKRTLEVWKVKVGSDIIILVSNNKYTSTGKKESGQVFSQASTGCPFYKTAIRMPAIICIFVTNCSYHWCSQPLWGAITPSWEQLQMKTVLHVQLIVTKQKAAGEDNLPH